MAEIDTSIYRTQAPTSPLETFQGIQGLVNARQQNALMQQQLTREKFDLARDQIGFMYNTFGALAAKPDLTIKDFSDVAALGVKTGRWTPSQAAAELSTLKDDPQMLREKALEYTLQSMSAAERLATIWGAPQNIDTGSTIQPGRQSPFGGFVPAGAPIQKTLSPSEQSELVTTVGPGNTPQAITKRQALIAAGDTSQLPGGGGAPMGGQMPASAQGEAPESDAMPQPPAAAPPTRAPAPGGGLQTGLAPGVATGMETKAKAAAEGANDLTTAARGAAERIAQIDNLNDLLGKFETGPLAAESKGVKAFVARNVPGGASIIDREGVAAQEEFNKQAEQMVQSQFQTIGGTGTDKQFNSAYASSPNEALSQLGNRGILAMLRGQNRAIQVMNKEWQAWQSETKRGPESFQEFQNTFLENYNPRVFQFAEMDDKGRRDMVKNMSPDERQRFGEQLRQAREWGWVKPSGGKE